MEEADAPLRSCLRKKGVRDPERTAKQKLRFHGEISFFTGDGETFLIPLPEPEDEASIQDTVEAREVVEEVVEDVLEDAIQAEEETKVGEGVAVAPVVEDSKPQKKLKKKGSKLRLKKGTFRLKNVKKLTKGSKKKHSKDIFLFSDTEIDETVRKRMKERVVSMDLGRPDWVDLEVEEEDSASSGAVRASTEKGRGALLRTGLFHGPVKLLRLAGDESSVASEMSSWIVLEEGPLMSFFCDELPTRDSLPVSCLVPMRVLEGHDGVAAAVAGLRSPFVSLRCCSDLDSSDICVSVIVFDHSSDRDNFYAAVTQLVPKQELIRKPSQDRSTLARPSRPSNPRKKQTFECVTIKRSGSNPPAVSGRLLVPKQDVSADDSPQHKEEEAEEVCKPSDVPNASRQPTEPESRDREEATETTALASLPDDCQKESVDERAIQLQKQPEDFTHPLSPRQEHGLYDTSVAKWNKGPTPEPIREEILSPRRVSVKPTEGERAVVDTSNAQWKRKRPDDEDSTMKQESAGGEASKGVTRSPEGKRLAIDTSQAQWVKKNVEEALKTPVREESATEGDSGRPWKRTSTPNSAQREMLSPRKVRPTPGAAPPSAKTVPLVDTGGAVWKKFEHSDDESDSESESESPFVERAPFKRKILPSQLSKNADRPLPSKPLPAPPPCNEQPKRGAPAEAADVNDDPAPIEKARSSPREEAPISIDTQGLSKESSKELCKEGSQESVKRGKEGVSGGVKSKFAVKKKLALPKPLLGKPGPFLSEQLSKTQRAAATFRSPRKEPVQQQRQQPQAATLRAVSSKPLPPAPGRATSPFVGSPKPLPAPPGQQMATNDRQQTTVEAARKPLPTLPRGGRGGGGRGAATAARRGGAKALPAKPDKNEIRRRLNMPKPLIGKPGTTVQDTAETSASQQQSTAAPGGFKKAPPSPQPPHLSVNGDGHGSATARGRGGAGRARGGAPRGVSRGGVTSRGRVAPSGGQGSPGSSPAAKERLHSSLDAHPSSSTPSGNSGGGGSGVAASASGRGGGKGSSGGGGGGGGGGGESTPGWVSRKGSVGAKAAPTTVVRAGDEQEEEVFPSISQRLALFGK